MRRSGWLAAVLSVIAPGLGQWYAGHRAGGAAMLCITLGLWVGLALALAGPPAMRSRFGAVMLLVVYGIAAVPAAVDAAQRAAGRETPLLANASVWYLLVMLASVGPLALPLLWQSPRLSRRAKIAWTIAVAVVAVLSTAFILVLGPVFDRLFDTLQSSLE